MTRLLPSLVIGVCLVLFTVVPVAAKGGGPLHPLPLVKANEDRILLTGLPRGQTGMWEERMFPNNSGMHTALCVGGLTIHQIFPGNGPVVGEGVFCLWDITVVGLNEFLAPTATLSGCLRGGNSRQLIEFSNCHILVEGSIIPGVTTLNGPSRHHVVMCPSGDGTFIGSFTTPGLSPEAGLLTADFRASDLIVTPTPGGGGKCDCDPVICTPCCATCPDE